MTKVEMSFAKIVQRRWNKREYKVHLDDSHAFFTFADIAIMLPLKAFHEALALLNNDLHRLARYVAFGETKALPFMIEHEITERDFITDHWQTIYKLSR